MKQNPVKVRMWQEEITRLWKLTGFYIEPDKIDEKDEEEIIFDIDITTVDIDKLSERSEDTDTEETYD